MTMTRDGWPVLALAWRKPNAFLMQCPSTESELASRRRVWLTVWHRPTQASTLVCGGGFFGVL